MWIDCETGITAKDFDEMLQIEAIKQGYYTPTGQINIDCIWNDWICDGKIGYGGKALLDALQALILEDDAEKAKEYFFKAYAQYVNEQVDAQCQECWDYVEDTEEKEKVMDEVFTRNVDDLGRMVIPKPIRTLLNIQEGDNIAITLNSDGTITLARR